MRWRTAHNNKRRIARRAAWWRTIYIGSYTYPGALRRNVVYPGFKPEFRDGAYRVNISGVVSQDHARGVAGILLRGVGSITHPTRPGMIPVPSEPGPIRTLRGDGPIGGVLDEMSFFDPKAMSTEEIK